MHKRVFSLLSNLVLCLLCVGALSACAHEAPPMNDTSAQINVKALSTAQTQQAQDLLAVKNLQMGQETNSNGALYKVAEQYYAASGAVCKHALIRRTGHSGGAMTGYTLTPKAEKLLACYKGDLAFLPSKTL